MQSMKVCPVCGTAHPNHCITDEEVLRQVNRAVDMIVALHLMGGHATTPDEREALVHEAWECVLRGEIATTSR